MNILLTIIQSVQVLAAIGMIGLILLQHGKGADAGAAFGGGAGSASLFGASGSANFMSRTTGVLAGVFLACTLGLAYFGNLAPAASRARSVLETVAPAAPASQIPGTSSAPAPAGTTAPSAPVEVPATATTGAAQIPGK